MLRHVRRADRDYSQHRRRRVLVRHVSLAGNPPAKLRLSRAAWEWGTA